MIERIVQLPPKHSFFLFGPRQTGKSTLIESRYTHSFWKVDLLKNDIFLKYSADPSLFRREAEQKIKHEGVQTIMMDEIQRLPLLLNDVQSLMGDFPCQFIMTGSSARKLKHGGANLLGGRAFIRHLFPFVYEEIKDHFSLDEVLRFGTLPSIWNQTPEEKVDGLFSYANTYLREEIQSEGIVRNLAGFSRFLNLASTQSGELISFSSMARECYLPARTVQSYYEILEDTLIGFSLPPWRNSLRKRLVAHSKFYLFDLGVINAVNQRLTGNLDPLVKGRLFEQWLILETYRIIHYHQKETNLYFWRTNHGAEVDLLLERHGEILAAIEIKLTSNAGPKHLTGLRAFKNEFPRTTRMLVCNAAHPYEIDGIQILPWKEYLQKLLEL